MSTENQPPKAFALHVFGPNPPPLSRARGHRRRKYATPEALAFLKANAGQWCAVAECNRKPGGRGAPSNVVDGFKKAGCEVTTRVRDGRIVIYAMMPADIADRTDTPEPSAN